MGASKPTKPWSSRYSRAARDHLRADAEHGVLAARAQPQMAVLEQEGGAVVLGSDRILVDRDVQHAQVGDAELDAQRRPGVGSHRARHLERRLLRQVIPAREDVECDVVLPHHALHGARAVAHLEEVDLAARPPRRQPAAQRHRLADVRAEAVDRHHRHALL